MKTANVKVDVIYIDPPYNTGKEFIYNDDFSTKKIVGSDDPHKHSKWLSFMKKRLQLAKELLTDDGVIFVSIDDNEQAYLKVMMDEIFGEGNFVCSFPRKTKSTTNDSSNGLNNQHDYILLYKKNKINLQGDIKDKSKYKNTDNDSNGIWTSGDPTTNGKGYFYKVINPFTKKEIIPPINCEWRFPEYRFYEMLKSGQIKWTNKETGRGFIFKRYWSQLRSKFHKVNSLLFDDNKFMNQKATKLLTKIFSDKNKLEIFSYPKGVELLVCILRFINNKNAIILDFFAGSGTTAQAVMELNKEDGGDRRFILVTNNENNIAQDITRERIYRVIKGHGSQGQKIKWEYSKEQKSLNENSMKYLKVKLIDKIDGEFEDIDKVKQLYLEEFNKELSIKDFKE